MRGARTIRAPAALALAIGLALACGGATSPEDQIRDLFARAQTAVAEQDLRSLRAMIAADYADARGHRKPDLEQALAAQILRGRVHAYLHVQALEVGADAPPASARATLLAGLARTPIGGLRQLAELHADVWVFELELADAEPGGGQWQVRRASWRPATRDDLHP